MEGGGLWSHWGWLKNLSAMFRERPCLKINMSALEKLPWRLTPRKAHKCAALCVHAHCTLKEAGGSGLYFSKFEETIHSQIQKSQWVLNKEL